MDQDPLITHLWPGVAPHGPAPASEADVPAIADYGKPAETTKPGCIVCPGGGYSGLAEHEGKPVALWLESLGIRAFVLRYRLGPRYHHPAELSDAERAMRYVRANAKVLGVDPVRLGIIGFSAGGHLASTVCTHYSLSHLGSSEAIDQQSSRPDWAILLYPVITLQGPFAHVGSRNMLLGEHPDEKLVQSLSNASAVSLDTPQTFICHGANDTVVPVENSLEYATALSGHRVPFELYIPDFGPHGFGLGQEGSVTDWKPLCHRWFQQRKILG